MWSKLSKELSRHSMLLRTWVVQFHNRRELAQRYPQIQSEVGAWRVTLEKITGTSIYSMLWSGASGGVAVYAWQKERLAKLKSKQEQLDKAKEEIERKRTEAAKDEQQKALVEKLDEKIEGLKKMYEQEKKEAQELVKKLSEDCAELKENNKNLEALKKEMEGDREVIKKLEANAKLWPWQRK